MSPPPGHRCGACGGTVDAGSERCGYCGASVVLADRLVDRTCATCGTTNPSGARTCTGCGDVVLQGVGAGTSLGKPCPGCGETLCVHTVREHPVAACPSCRGLWLAPHLFDRVVDATARYLETTSGGPMGSSPEARPMAYRKCPDCGVLMNRRQYHPQAPTVLDTCVAHGIWLDDGELWEIARFEVDRPAPPQAPGPVADVGFDDAAMDASALAEAAMRGDLEITVAYDYRHEDGRVESGTKVVRPGDPEFLDAFTELLRQRKLGQG